MLDDGSKLGTPAKQSFVGERRNRDTPEFRPLTGETEKVITSFDEDGGLAQLGERLPCKQEVSGSIPLISTIFLKTLTEVPTQVETSLSFFGSSKNAP